MAVEKDKAQAPEEPRGFGEHSRGLAGEYAHEQGWGLDVEERTKQPDTPQDIDGGNDYNYGATDFGDDAVNTAISPEHRDPMQNTTTQNTEQTENNRDETSKQ